MVGLSSAREQIRFPQPVSAETPASRESADDRVLETIFNLDSVRLDRPPVARVVVENAETAGRREAAIAVARELARNPDAEAYWQRLCDAFNDRTAQAEELAEEGVETPFDRAVIQKIRWEMNALVPRLAEARVRRDALSFSDPNLYADRLERQVAHADRTAAFAEGDEIAMRSAVDNGRIAREQLAALKRLTTGPDAWRLLRAEAANKGAHSILDDLPTTPAPREKWRVDLAALQAQRAKLGFWNVFQKMKLDEKIAPLLRHEERMSRSVAGPR